jgi:hypothetical protein
MAVQAGRIAVVCNGLFVGREAYIGLAREGHTLQVLQGEELVRVKSSLVEASPVERNGFVGVVEQGTQTSGLIAS